MFVGVAHCVYCGEETNSDDFECDECKRRVSREMRPAGELSAAAREFIERLAQLCQSQLAGKTQEPHQGNGNGHKPAAVDERDLQVKQSAELPDVSPDDFRPFVPTNEQGVVYMTGSIAKDIGYRLTHVQSAYPDAIFVSPSQKVLKVEFEYASSNFIQHGHDPALCDMVICWNRDRDLPVPVLELSRYYDPQTGRWDFRGV
jgi:hypothetical protein